MAMINKELMEKLKEQENAIVIEHEKGGDAYIFKSKRRTHFLFLLSDLSAFGNPAKKPMGIRGNYRKCMKKLLKNKLDEFELILKTGEYFEIFDSVLSKGHTEEEAREYNEVSGHGGMKVEPAKLSVTIKIPPGEAIKVYSIEERFYLYLVNQGGNFYQSTDFEAVEEITGVYF